MALLNSPGSRTTSGGAAPERPASPLTRSRLGPVQALGNRGQSPATLIVTGWRSSVDQWTETARCCAAPGNEVWVINLLAPTRSPTSYKRLLGPLDAVITAVGKPVVLVGHSMGAVLVGAYQTERRDPRVLGVALVAPPSSPPTFQTRVLLLRARVSLHLPRWMSAPMFRREAQRISAAASGARTALQMFREVRTVVRLFNELDQFYDPAHIPGPVLTLLFAQDRTFSVTRLCRWLALYSGDGPRHVEVVLSHHMPRRPEEHARVADKLLRFASEVGGL